MTVGLLLTV